MFTACKYAILQKNKIYVINLNVLKFACNIKPNSTYKKVPRVRKAFCRLFICVSIPTRSCDMKKT